MVESKKNIKMYTYISILVIVGASRGAEVEAVKCCGSNSCEKKTEYVKRLFDNGNSNICETLKLLQCDKNGLEKQ